MINSTLSVDSNVIPMHIKEYAVLHAVAVKLQLRGHKPSRRPMVESVSARVQYHDNDNVLAATFIIVTQPATPTAPNPPSTYLEQQSQHTSLPPV